MEKDFWLGKWDKMEIGFHREDVNSTLEKYRSELELKDDSVIFVPLCGKTLDMIYLSKICKVVGVELAPKAIEQFFNENDIEYTTREIPGFKIYTSRDERIVIYEGDLFDLPESIISTISHVYDRASIVALPVAMRKRYASFMQKISFENYLMLAFEYDQESFEGPPFTVTEEEIREIFDRRSIKLLENVELSQFSIPFVQKVYLLSR